MPLFCPASQKFSLVMHLLWQMFPSASINDSSHMYYADLDPVIPNKKRPPPQTVEASFSFLSHLRHTNICVLFYGRNPSASTCITCFGAATQEGFSIYPTRTASQLTRLSVTFRKYVLAPSSSFKIDDNYFNHSIRICQQFLIIFSNSFFELSFSCPLLCSIHPHLSTYMPLI